MTRRFSLFFVNEHRTHWFAKNADTICGTTRKGVIMDCVANPDKLFFAMYITRSYSMSCIVVPYVHALFCHVILL